MRQHHQLMTNENWKKSRFRDSKIPRSIPRFQDWFQDPKECSLNHESRKEATELSQHDITQKWKWVVPKTSFSFLARGHWHSGACGAKAKKLNWCGSPNLPTSRAAVGSHDRNRDLWLLRSPSATSITINTLWFVNCVHKWPIGLPTDLAF